jgi:hypothetical protein
MQLRRPRLRTATTLALALGLSLASAACDKGGDTTNKPAGDKGGAAGDPGQGGAKDSGGADYVYAADGFTLDATMKLKFEIASSQGAGAASIEAKSSIEATPADGKLKVHGKVVELVKYEGTGQLDPEFMKKQAIEQGQEPVDIVEQLGKAEGWMLVDYKGELDKDASKALAENQGKDDDMDFGLFNLPDLPSIDLTPGEKVKLPTREDERVLPFGAIPVEVDETWTLRKIENGIAELDVTSEVSGATEISGGQGTAMVSTMEESSFTILFNIETKLPVSISGYSQSETAIDAQGQSFSFSTNNELEGTYKPAGG